MEQKKPLTRTPPGDVTIEIGTNRNQNVAWPMTRDILRGHWQKAHLLHQELTEVTTLIPDLPGQRIKISAARATAWILDPLNLPEFAVTMAKLNFVLGAEPALTGGKVKPATDTEHGNLTPTLIKSWLYWMRRLVDEGKGHVVEGKLPTLAEIAELPGKTRCQNYDSGGRARYREDQTELQLMSAEVL
jgi:hypothetical protein